MEFKELIKKNEKELQALLAESRDKLRDLKFKVAARQLKNIREIRVVKELIARVLTVLNNKKTEK